jgi:hypothetical protein
MVGDHMGILCAVIFFSFFFLLWTLHIFFLNGRDGTDGEGGRMDLFSTLLLLSSVRYSFEETGRLFQNALRGPSRLVPYHLTHTPYTPHTYIRARAQPTQYFNTRQRLCCDYGPHPYCHQRALPPPPTRCEHVVCCH